MTDERVGAPLEAEIAELRDALAERDEVIAKQLEELDQLRRELTAMLRRLYGKKSEKLDPAQLELSFGDLADGVIGALGRSQEEPPGTSAPDDEESLLVPKRRARRGGVRVIRDDVERERREVLPPEAERCCPDCGEHKARIGEEVSEELQYVPARLRVIEHVRIKLACRECEAHVSTAAAPLRPIPRSNAGASLLAHVVVSKYADHLPLYRQEKMLVRSGLDISRQSACRRGGHLGRGRRTLGSRTYAFLRWC